MNNNIENLTIIEVESSDFLWIYRAEFIFNNEECEAIYTQKYEMYDLSINNKKNEGIKMEWADMFYLSDKIQKKIREKVKKKRKK